VVGRVVVAVVTVVTVVTVVKVSDEVVVGNSLVYDASSAVDAFGSPKSERPRH
jgi:hypothetical protein